MAKRKNKPPKSVYEQGLIFPICQMFFDGKTTNEIASWVRNELRVRGIKDKFNREHVYPAISDALEMDLLRCHPPREKVFEERIAAVANSSSEETILREVSISRVHGPSSRKYLASVAAEEILRLIKKRAAEKCQRLQRNSVPIHIGLGAGRTTQRVARSLGSLLRAEGELENVSELVFHALSSGFVSDDPLASPVAFFSYFADLDIRVKYVALFSPPLVKVRGYDKSKELPGAAEAFAQARKIEIVTSALADVKNRYGLLNRLEHQYKQKKSSARVGDVQFRPYSEDGPLKDDPNGFRALTLFDLADFVKMVEEEGKYLVLVAPPNQGGGTRARALLPLIRNPLLKVWSHLFMDFDTAKEVVRLLPPREEEESESEAEKIAG